MYVERLATQGPRLFPEDIAGVGRSMNIDIWIVLSSEPSEDDDAVDIGESVSVGVDIDGHTSVGNSRSITKFESEGAARAS